jgi:uncharacterized protein (TIGR02646 family)
MLTGIIKARIRKKANAKNCHPTKRAIWIRDDGRCQYCNIKLGLQSMTLDHVLPKSRGGASDWNNLVSSCHDCNQKKGARTPEECSMTLNSKPIRPWDYITFIK